MSSVQTSTDSIAPAAEHRPPSYAPAHRSILREILVPALGAAPVALIDRSSAVLIFLAFLTAGLLNRRKHAAVATLPLARLALPAAQIVMAAVGSALIILLVLGTTPPVDRLIAGTFLVLLASAGIGLRNDRRAATTVLVLGTPQEAAELQRTVREVGARRYRVVATTASLLSLDEFVESSGSDLIVFTDHIARQAVLGHVAAAMRTRPVRATHIDAFCESALGVVPLDSVDAAWLADLADPTRGAHDSRATRAMDIAVSALLLIPVLPLLAVLAPLIRADGGGSAFFRQDRVGRGGRPFSILKLRTMTGVGSDWSSANDPRITRLGAILRKTHIDELPQIINVLKGDMSLVGPRPEQVGISRDLEQDIPLFPYRHMVRPGITGWARIRCGYASTTEQSALKLGNDLFYIKHRTLVLDLAIMLETLRLTLFEKQHEVQAPAARYVLGTQRAASRDRAAGYDHAPAFDLAASYDRAPAATERRPVPSGPAPDLSPRTARAA